MTTLAIADPGPFGGRALTFVNRCRAQGFAVDERATHDHATHDHTCPDNGGGFSVRPRKAPSRAEPGLFTLDSDAATPVAGTASALPRIAIYNGAAIGYPYWAYYAHALLSLGLLYTPVGAEEVAAGALDGFDLLIMPGGFATWGLDRAEGIAGVDAAIRAFIARGGAYIGSCGGAFYASEGRPGWLELMDATPRFTQEYLLTGAAMLSIAVDDPELGRGLPESVEVPYYHGPVFLNRPRRAATPATFQNYISPSHLFIDNPLDPAFFRSEMAGTPAIFRAADKRAIVFSPHPEMGEFVRKGIAIAGYARHYLPIRGHKVLDETLRFYLADDCAGFRLIYNAISACGLFNGDPATSRTATLPVSPPLHETLVSKTLAGLDLALQAAFTVLQDKIEQEDAAMAGLLACELERLRAEWALVNGNLHQAGDIDPSLVHALTAALDAAATALASPFGIAELFVLSELPIRLCTAAFRIILCDKILETC